MMLVINWPLHDILWWQLKHSWWNTGHQRGLSIGVHDKTVWRWWKMNKLPNLLRSLTADDGSQRTLLLNELQWSTLRNQKDCWTKVWNKRKEKEAISGRRSDYWCSLEYWQYDSTGAGCIGSSISVDTVVSETGHHMTIRRSSVWLTEDAAVFFSPTRAACTADFIFSTNTSKMYRSVTSVLLTTTHFRLCVCLWIKLEKMNGTESALSKY